MAQDIITPGADVIMSLLHSHVHTGDIFSATYYDTDVDIASPLYIYIVTPASTGVHFEYSITSSQPGRIQLLENIGQSDPGTGITAVNLNRNSSNTTSTAIYYDPTVTGDGTTIQDLWLPGTAHPVFSGASATRKGLEWNLKANEEYFVKFTTDVDNTRVSFACTWYDESRLTP